ncbi:MAG: ATP-binding cassette domain-containing protein [Rhodospirillales bacterium]|nr:ATP-binding cassette domain-containing protein [Rhodospirillales bacterium]
MPPLLEVEDLTVRFRTMGLVRQLLTASGRPWVEAVAGVSFSLAAASTFALVGESGSGKTTLGRALIGLVQPSAGRVRFDGLDRPGRSASAWKRWRRQMAMMFQDPVGSLSPRLTVRALIAEPLAIHGTGARDLEVEARRLLAMVGLSPDFAGRFPHELSGGQARRVGVARALSLNPRLVIADEPTAGLDVSVQGEILNLMSRLQHELGLAYLLITHNLAIVRHVSGRVAVMYLGRLVETGPTDEVFARPAHPYTHGLLAAQPHPDPDRRRLTAELSGEVPSLRNRPPACEFHTRCPFAQPLCREQAPELRVIAPGRQVRCHFPLS